MKTAPAFRTAIVVALIAAACGSLSSSSKSGEGNTASLTLAIATGADFSGNSVQICGSRAPPADSKYFCNNSLSSADGACPCFNFNSDGTLIDPTTGGTAVLNGLCASVDVSSDATAEAATADWEFTYAVFNGIDCTGLQLNDGNHNFTCFDVANLAAQTPANESIEPLNPGPNTNNIVCETVNAFKSFVFTSCNAICNMPFGSPPGPPDAGCDETRFECSCEPNGPDGGCTCADGGITSANLPSGCFFDTSTCNIFCEAVPDAGVPDAAVPDAAEDAPPDAPPVGPVCGNPVSFDAGGQDLGLGFIVMVQQNAILSSNEIEGAIAIGNDLTIGLPASNNPFSFNIGAPAGDAGIGNLNYALGGQLISLVVGNTVIGPTAIGGEGTIGKVLLQNGAARIANIPTPPWAFTMNNPQSTPPSPAACLVASGDSGCPSQGAWSNPQPPVGGLPLVRPGMGIQMPNQSIAQVTSDAGINFTAVFDAYVHRSETLAACAAGENGSVNAILTLVTDAGSTSLGPPPYTNPDLVPADAGSEVTINLEGGTTNVVDISSVALGNIQTLNFIPPPADAGPGTSVVINVMTPLLSDGGVSGMFNNWVPALNNFTPGATGTGQLQAPFVLYNFPDALQITQINSTSPSFINGDGFKCNDLDGTILAPMATLIDLCPQNNVGNIIVQNYIQGPYDGGTPGTPDAGFGNDMTTGQEVHYAPFDGGILCPCQ